MIVYGSDGNTYTIRDRFAGDGEGDLHNIEGHPELVAKIFHADKRGSRGRWAKVDEWTKMYRSLDETFTKQVVIPQVALYDSNNKNYQTFVAI